MIDGQSYYQHQSVARRISSLADVRREAEFESAVFDRLILPELRKAAPGAIYEAACGPGILQQWLINKGYDAIEGSDFSVNEVNLAKQSNPRIHHGDSVQHLESFPNGHFSAIIALDFYEHLPREDFRRFLEIASKALKPGGVMILRGPNGDSPFVGLNLYNDITHVWTYTTVAMHALLTLGGFSHTNFDDDTDKALHRGRWWKLPLMIISEKILTAVTFAATRQRIRFWGMSLYVYATK